MSAAAIGPTPTDRAEALTVEAGERLRAWVERYPAKALAREFGVAVATAKSWKAGNPPAFRHLLMMIDRWGAEFVEAVLAVPSERDLLARAESLSRALDLLTKDYRDATAALRAETDEGRAAVARGAAAADRPEAFARPCARRRAAAAWRRAGLLSMALAVGMGLCQIDDSAARRGRNAGGRTAAEMVLRAYREASV